MRLSVVSPFVDRRHGTERVLLEQIRRLARDYGCEIHLYAQRVEDLELGEKPHSNAREMGAILWHKVPSVPGPHLVQYLWWFFANHICRWVDRRFRGLSCDLLYSPGINALDADAIAVHIVFHELRRHLGPHLLLSSVPAANWLRLIHRRLYYRLLIALERRIYRDPGTSLVAVSSLVARHLAAHFQRTNLPVIVHGVDAQYFAPSACRNRRADTRAQFRLSQEDFVILLIGNDWKTKGLDALLRALAQCRDLPVRLLVVGADDRSAFEPLIRGLALADRVQFRMPSDDVLQFYAAADAYAGPSLEDAYGLPILEAMACGLPVITSIRAGVSEILRDGVDGLLLHDPEDSRELAALIRKLISGPALRTQLAEAAAATAQQFTWDRNAAETWKFLNEVAARKQRSGHLDAQS